MWGCGALYLLQPGGWVFSLAFPRVIFYNVSEFIGLVRLWVDSKCSEPFHGVARGQQANDSRMRESASLEEGLVFHTVDDSGLKTKEASGQ